MQYYRRLPLRGLHNARDLGGYAVEGGGRTRFGVFIRSEAPCELKQADIDALKAYGVTESLDLRSGGEVAMRPSDLAGQMIYHHKSLFNEAVAFAPDDKQAPPPPPKPPAGGPKEHDWGSMYQGMAEESHQWAIEVLTLAAQAEGAVLYHCTTGKDRTGLLSCYLLSIAGVPAPDIIADYCVSQVYLRPTYEKLLADGMDNFGKDLNAPFFQTPATAMESLLSYMEKTYGGVVPFLRTIGVPEEVMTRIREKFVER